MFKAHRFDVDQMPAPEYPTYAVVRNVSVWADKKSVLLRSSDKNRNVPRLTPKAARKVAKALTRAAAGPAPPGSGRPGPPRTSSRR